MKRSRIIVCSISLNLSLLVWIGWMTLSPVKTLEHHAVPIEPIRETVHVTATSAASVPSSTNNSPALPPFHWSQVESTNYSNYISNLKNIGCPEPVIRRIISGDLDELYTQRRQAMLAPWQSQVWDQAARGLKSPLTWIEEMKPTEKDLRQNAGKLLQEKAEVLKVLLGDPINLNSTSKLYTPNLRSPRFVE